MSNANCPFTLIGPFHGPTRASAGSLGLTPSAPWRHLPDEQATTALGESLAVKIQQGEAICLWGPLGSGKSTLARGLVRALTRPDEDVPSPTFTLVQFYQGPQFPLAHFDLYRLSSGSEAYEIGLDEALEDGAVLIEWPERLEGDLPPNRLDIVFDRENQDEGRRVHLITHGNWEGRGLEL
jgi:tRNA threonylcarbamoyladenosine biosynthesis protein TsaE